MAKTAQSRRRGGGASLRGAGAPLTPEGADERKLWNRPQWSEKEEVRPPIEERVLRRKQIINDFKCPRGLI